jgi:SAM-dependent methyltransferase
MSVVYNGRDLEAMSFAVNYHSWMLDEFRPFLGRRIIEVGAGTGGFSRLLLPLDREKLILIEPSKMIEDLRSNLSGNENISIVEAIFSDVAELLAAERPDSVIYVNVLEHIQDDVGELKLVYRTLAPGGRIFIFVPAHQSLFGAFDVAVGHFRRYSRIDLERKCLTAGFKIIRSINFDLLGVILWWIKFRLLRSSDLSPAAVALYDKYAVPVTRFFEGSIGAPVGKNILLIGEKG